MLDQKLIRQLVGIDSPILQLNVINTAFEDFDKPKVTSKKVEFYEVYVEYYGIAAAICEKGDIPFQEISFGKIKIDNIKYVQKIFSQISALVVSKGSYIQADAIKARYSALLGAGFTYEFSDGDVSRIQQLINELRELISGSNKLEEDHQRRLLAKLEKLQSELHKKVSDLDKCWGLIGEAGVVFGKLGRDAKPIVDRIREIAEIAWRTQARSEQLPSASEFPLLEKRDDADED